MMVGLMVWQGMHKMVDYNRKLVMRHINVHDEVNLQWLRRMMENRIDAVLYCQDQTIEYKEYENDSDYNFRIKKE